MESKRKMFRSRLDIHDVNIKLTEKNRDAKKRLAVHEAGHALMLAGYNELPTLVCVMIDGKYESDTYNGRGRVWHSVDELENPSAAHIEWLMLMNLAGYVAEWQLNSSHQTNQVNYDSDVEDWHRLYLLHAAKNKDVKLKELLRREQEQLLDAFMKENIILLHEIADHLVEKDVILYDILHPILQKISYPISFPNVVLASLANKTPSPYDYLPYGQQIILKRYQQLSPEERVSIKQQIDTLLNK